MYEMTCIPDEYSAVKQQVRDGLKILQNYAWLLDSFVLDFYTEKHWEKLPVQWRSMLDIVDLEEFGVLVDYRNQNTSFKRVWPLSFLALRSAAHCLSLPRKQSVYLSTSEHKQFINVMGSKCLGEDEYSSQNTGDTSIKSQALGNEFLTNPRFAHVFTKHVKPKKRHEIGLMAKIAAETAETVDCKFIVDIGSGLGHLSRMLAYGYDLHVCCVEAQSSLAEQARKLDLALEVTLSKYMAEDKSLKFHRPVHISNTLCSSVDENNFLQALKTAYGIVNNDFNFGIVGLHPCGDLGPTLLQLFVKCSNAKFINIVGCCYMKLSTTEENSTKFKGYPLSNFISEQVSNLSYEAREIACHAIENYCERLCTGDVSHLKIHCYRAVLERILVKYWPEFQRTGIRSVRHVNNLPFEKYCQVATEKLGVVIPSEDVFSTETQDELSHWKQVVIFYSLRLLLAPLVETTLLVDRLLFLVEKGLDGKLMPVFDPSLSPRNHILTAMKSRDK